jgi:hypothetical protein
MVMSEEDYAETRKDLAGLLSRLDGHEHYYGDATTPGCWYMEKAEFILTALAESRARRSYVREVNDATA